MSRMSETLNAAIEDMFLAGMKEIDIAEALNVNLGYVEDVVFNLARYMEDMEHAAHSHTE